MAGKNGRRRRAVGFATGLALVLSAKGAAAQSSMTIEEFTAKVNEGAARIAQFQQVLQNPDARVQYEAVKLMLASKDPALVRIAKEHALFSTNPVLRNAAIGAIFDAGGVIRLQLTATDEKSADVMRWARVWEGATSGNTGNVMFSIGKKSDDCWLRGDSSNCMLWVSGTTVKFYVSFNSPGKGQAALQLGADGVLRGPIHTSGGSAQVAIDLKE